MGVKNLLVPVHLYYGPFGEHPVVPDALPCRNDSLHGHSEGLAGNAFRVRKNLHLGHVLPRGDLGKKVVSGSGATTFHDDLVGGHLDIGNI